MSSILTRRKLLANLGKTAGACTVANLPFLLAGCGGGSSLVMPPPPGDGYFGTDDQLLEEITRGAVKPRTSGRGYKAP